ncbi:MAG TPA: MFS transporter [Bacillota bacterium]|nr:MFS transporter [Bacillota bacterium]
MKPDQITVNQNGMKQVYIASFGLFITYIDSTIINVAIPEIMNDYHIGLDLASWLINTFVITLAVLMIAMGKMAEVFGKANVYKTGIILFMISSLLCGIAPSVYLLIFFRMLQGIAGAMIIPTSMSLAREAVSKEQVGKAIGMWGAMGALGAASGPPLGGLITEYLGWRWIFFLNIPIILAILPATLRIFRNYYHERKPAHFDPLGMLTIGMAIFFLTYGIIQGQKMGWMSVQIMSFFGICIVSLLIFIVIERKVKYPLMNFSIFRNRIYAAGLLSNLLAGMLTMGVNLLIPEYLTQVKGYDLLVVSILTTLLPLTSLFVGPLIGRMVDKVGFMVPLALGYLCALIGFSCLATMNMDLPMFWLVCILLITGTGNGILMITCVVVSTASLPPQQLSMGSGIFSMVRNVGGALGIALMVSITLSVENSYSSVLAEKGMMLVKQADLPNDVSQEFIKQLEVNREVLLKEDQSAAALSAEQKGLLTEKDRDDISQKLNSIEGEMRVTSKVFIAKAMKAALLVAMMLVLLFSPSLLALKKPSKLTKVAKK